MYKLNLNSVFVLVSKQRFVQWVLSCVWCFMTVIQQSTSSNRIFLGIAYSSRITLSLFTDLSLSTVPVNILSLYQLVLCLLRVNEDRRTSSKRAIGGGDPEAK